MKHESKPEVSETQIVQFDSEEIRQIINEECVVVHNSQNWGGTEQGMSRFEIADTISSSILKLISEDSLMPFLLGRKNSAALVRIIRRLELDTVSSEFVFVGLH